MTFANQTRILTNNIKDLLTYIGQGFIAAIRPAVVVLNLLMTKLIQAAKAFRTFMYTLTGYKGAGSQGGIVDDLAGVGDMYDDISGIGGAGNDAADGLSNASGAANDLKKSLSVLPFDQLNQLAAAAENTASGLGDVSSDVGSIGSVGDLGLGDIETGVMDLDSSELVEEINQWADSIRRAFVNQRWNTLGFVIANGINEGLDYLYSIISWDNVGPRITSFIHAFSTTFNSLVNWLDWDRMGRVIGAGINTVVNSLNGLLVNIDWENLGYQFSTGIMGIVQEVDWGELGELVGNKFNAVWKALYGFFSGLNPEVLGAEAARFVKKAFKTIDFGLLSDVLTSGLNTVIGAMSKFVDEHPFEGLSLKLASFLNDTITGVDWQNAGETIGNLFKNTLKGISTFIRETDFKELGNQVGNFIEGLDWEDILRDVGSVIWDAIKAALEFFKGTFSAVPVETAIVTAIGLLKFTGLGSALGKTIWTKIAGSLKNTTTTKTFEDEIKTHVEDTIVDAINNVDTSGVTNAGQSIWSALFSGFKPALIEAGVLVGIAELGIQMQELTDKLKGGNGELSDFGGLIDSISNEMAPTLGTELFKIKEILEDENAEIDEIKTRLTEFFLAQGISSTALTTMINDVGGSINLTTEQMEIMYDVASRLPETTGMTEEAFNHLKDSLTLLQQEGLIPSNEHMSSLLGVLDEQYSSGMTAKEAWDALTQKMDDMSLSVEDVIEILGEDFAKGLEGASEATTDLATDVETEMANAQKSVDTHTKNMVDTAEKNLADVNKEVEDSFGGVSDTSKSDWSAADLSVEDALKLMRGASSEQMRAIYKNVESYTNSIYNITTNNWSALSLRVPQLMDEMNGSISEKLETTKSLFSNFGNDIAGSLNLFWAGRSAIQSFVDGFRSMYVPTPHFRISNWRQHNLPNGGMMHSPVFEVNWYKDGGIFGNASVIGVGEAGREAVLPLENRRSMRMIADSIVSSAGSGFMDESTMINAVAAGVSMAMSGMSFGDTPQNDVVVMIDGREVARAVNRANERTGYRNNP